MGFSKFLIACAFSITVVCYAAPVPQVTANRTIYAYYSAVQVAEDGDIDSAHYSIGADGSNSIPGSDVVMSVKFCPPNSPFICVHGDFYNFAVPRHVLKAGEKWKFANRTYEVVPGYLPHGMFQQPIHSKDINRTFVIFKSTITVNVIRTIEIVKGETCIHTFLYSRSHGVIGDLGRCDNRKKHYSWNYWLTAGYGLGSPIFEGAISSEAMMTQSEAAAFYNQ